MSPKTNLTSVLSQRRLHVKLFRTIQPAQRTDFEMECKGQRELTRAQPIQLLDLGRQGKHQAQIEAPQGHQLRTRQEIHINLRPLLSLL
jgi:hypothetical protein